MAREVLAERARIFKELASKGMPAERIDQEYDRMLKKEVRALYCPKHHPKYKGARRNKRKLNKGKITPNQTVTTADSDSVNQAHH